MKRCIIVSVCALLGSFPVMAEPINEIRQHNTMLQENVHYEYFLENSIRILQGVSGQSFEFEAVLVENSQVVGLGTIGRIVVDENNTGPVVVTVLGHEGREYGATNVGQIRLIDGSGSSTLAGLKISGTLGALGPTQVEDVTGWCSIQGDVLSDVELDGGWHL